MDIKVTPVPHDQRKPKPPWDDLGFGRYFTDHAFYVNYESSTGWHNARIERYGAISLDPAALVLHYGQEIFEGLKAYWGKDDKVRLFRPDKNIERLNNSAERMCMPTVDPEFALRAIKELVKLERDWIPRKVGESLYIRPTMIATEAALGVKVSDKYLFYVILSPVAAYYAEGFSPIKIYVEDKYVRSAPGLVGAAKTSGNYAASLLAAKKAKDRGFTQVLWLDARERKWVEEVGTMNQFFVIGDEVVTSPLTGSILPGVTRLSVIEILREWGYKVNERMISIDEVIEAAKTGDLKEAFGTGTAAIISPVGSLTFKDQEYVINDFQIGDLSQKLYDEILAIQYGMKEDARGWTVLVA
ncbi:MAG: branched-chain amino acid aminotransferase [Promethearchaeota archaeon]